jgi:hypothetical protein
MTTASASELWVRSEGTSTAVAPALAVAAFASIGAGLIHAAAIGVHSEHRQAVVAFTLLAVAQIAWGIGALLGSGRLVPAAGVAVNTAALGGWVMAKASGIGFVEGLDVAEDAQFADTAAAAMALVAVAGAVSALTIARASQATFGRAALVITAALAAAIATPAMVSAGSHSHAGGHDHDGAAANGSDGGHSDAAAATGDEHGHDDDGAPHEVAVVPPKPYDPTKPIDLGGVEGVTLEQQARAENLIAVTLARIPKYSDPAAAEADGYRSIGDALTGDEHYINVAYFDDGRILDADYPESLVYQPDGRGGKKLVAAMYMLAPDQTLDDVPDVGGKLTQWHIHNNLCFTPENIIAGLSGPNGCEPPLHPGSQAPMIHVWITPHPCGPFAALEGVGAGQIKEGEERLCDHAHGA